MTAAAPVPAAAARTVERVTRAHAARVAATLGLDPAAPTTMQSLPPGWHWAFCLATPARAALAVDGLPASDPLLPQMEGFSARVMGGTTFDVVQPVPMEAELACTTRIAGIVNKTGRSGALRILTVERLYSVSGAMAISERQEVVYLQHTPRPAADDTSPPAHCAPPGVWQLAFDETDVFRFSAVTFNTHRIHYDAPYAARTEGWAGILVQAKLLALHMLQACERRHGAAVRAFSFRSVSPLPAPAQAWIDLTEDRDGAVQATVHGRAGLHLTATVRY